MVRKRSYESNMCMGYCWTLDWSEKKTDVKDIFGGIEVEDTVSIAS